MSRLSGWNAAWFIFTLWTAMGIASQAQTFTTLHTFENSDGSFPYGALVQGLDGNFYGTTWEGGREICYNGCGTVFKINPAGTFATVHEFVGTDGSWPQAGLILAANGNLYGVTMGYESPHTTVYAITPEGAFSTLYSNSYGLGGSGSSMPIFPLMQDTIDGNFYGTAPYDGPENTKKCGNPGCGTVFKITLGGTLTVLYNFCNLAKCADGIFPAAQLVQANNGVLYGTTTSGGGPAYAGVVFKIGTEGALNILHQFNLLTDGADPMGGLTLGTDGNFYGTTENGGDLACPALYTSPYYCGTIFKMTPAGALTTLHTFDGTDGGNPLTALIQATDGNFYGTTSGVGYKGACSGNNCGSIFQLTPDGTLTTLHSFDKTDGMNPAAALVQGTDGNIYGTTNGFVGQHLYGTVFQLSMGLAPFVKTVPAGAYTHTQVLILGTNLTGATSVTFSGKTAVFTVVSPTEIQATVPGNATTGTVEVVTPGGTLLSNVPFQVL
jgi:uncharacterized repeat protein (TIGR03803 family)